MASFRNDFWRHVLDSAAVGEGPVAVVDAFLAEAEINELDVPLRVQHDIFGLQITEDDPKMMKMPY